MVSWRQKCSTNSNKSKEIYNLHNIDNRFIYKFLQECRISIANYIRHCYILDPLAGKNAYNHISVDESLFSHLNNKQQLVIGLINCETNDIRMEIVENRDTDTLKQIIEKHVLPGNYITTDAWKGYTFLDYLILDIYMMFIIMQGAISAADYLPQVG